MKRPRTLVGRMALLQILTTTAAIGAVVVLSWIVVTRLVRKERDRALMNAATATLIGVSELDDPLAVGERRLARELDSHRPAGVRIEAIDDRGGSVAAAGEGPRLHAAGDDQCADQEGWRVCERAVGALRVLVGRSRHDEDAARSRFLLVLALTAAVVVGIGALLSRAVARRGLRPFEEVSARFMSLTPGRGERLHVTSGLAEVDSFARRFDELLARVDEAVARERRFSAQASHELRTPLTVLRGELEELVHRPQDSPGSAESALASAEKLVALVESLLLFGRSEARFDPKELELLNLADVVRDEVGRTVDPTGRASDVVLDLADEVLVLGSQELLGRAVSNLLDNAAKYGRSGSPIEVSVAEGRGSARVTVRDRGPGVPPELSERIFEPFFRDPRTRAARPGHGLGLPLARAVAHAHGGNLRFLPNAPEGSVFELTIPVHHPG